MLNFDIFSKNWDNYTYPWRPDDALLSIIDKYITNDGMNILILGATKEFRFRYRNHNITVCDISKNMIMDNDIGNKNEKILNTNWFDLKNREYDLILGDLVLLMYDYDEKIILIDTLKKNLSPHGGIILRLVKNNGKKLDKTITSLIKKIQDFKYLREFFNYLSFELVNAFGLSGENIFKLLLSSSEKLGILYKEQFLSLTPYNGAKNHCLDGNNFKKLVKGYKGSILLENKMIYVTEYVIKINNLRFPEILIKGVE